MLNKGLTSSDQRPLLNQESQGTLDTDIYSGHENYETVNHFTLHKGDGACLIIAKNIAFEDTARIGEPNLHGVARCRGASDSLNKPDGGASGVSCVYANKIVNQDTTNLTID